MGQGVECSNKKRKRLIRCSVGKKSESQIQKTAPNSFRPTKAKNTRKNNTAQSLGTGGFCSAISSRLALPDPTARSTAGLPVPHHLLESAQVHVHRVSAAIQPAHPLSSSSSLEKGTANHPSIFAMRTP